MSLNAILLDGAQGLIFVPIFFIIHLITTLFIEGAILYFYKYKFFKKCLRDAFVVNLCSLIVGLFCLFPFRSLTDGVDSEYEIFVLLLLFYLQTILVEGFVLKKLNNEFPLKKIVGVTLVMNAVTYFTLYIILMIID